MSPSVPRRTRLGLLRPLLLGGFAVPALAASGGADGVGIELHLATTAVMGAPPPIVMVILGALLVGGALVRRSARMAAKASSSAPSVSAS